MIRYKFDDNLIKAMRNRGATVEEIANVYGCSQALMSNHLIKIGMRTRPYAKRGPYLTWSRRKDMTYEERVEFKKAQREARMQ